MSVRPNLMVHLGLSIPNLKPAHSIAVGSLGNPVINITFHSGKILTFYYLNYLYLDIYCNKKH